MLRSGTLVSEISKVSIIHLSTVYRIKKKFETTGDVTTSKRSGRLRSVVTNKLKTATKRRMERNPERSVRKMVMRGKSTPDICEEL